jgi:3-hydroxymyristoyl/3-hydroxydecanoyl-(acyl carrier protein) dehydratase
MTEPLVELPIPHREPFLFLSVVSGTTEDEGLFLYEFPRTGDSWSRKLMPGLLMVEAMAQAAAAWHGLVSSKTAGGPETGLLASVDGVRVSGRPRPGDRLTIKIRAKKKFGAMAMLDGEVWVHHRMFAQARLVVRRGVPEGV